MRAKTLLIAAAITPLAVVALAYWMLTSPREFMRFIRDVLTTPVLTVSVGPSVEPEEHQTDGGDQ